MPRMNLGLPFVQCNLPTCLERSNLLRCGACGAAVYCGTAHQRADRPVHKSSCRIVKDTREKYRAEEAALRASAPEDPFETLAGHFWSAVGTRPYMQARFDYMTALLNIRTGEAVDMALAHALAMLRLDRSDNRGVRGHVPAMYLRLGRDQEAYDFIKWWAVKGVAGYDFHDLSLPYLDLHGEDALETDEVAWKRLFQISLIVGMMLIKLRLLLDVTMLQQLVRRRSVKPLSSQEKMDALKEEALSDVLLSRPDIVNQDDYAATVDDLKRQVRTLYERVKQRNRFYWPAVLHPEPYAHATPTLYSPGSEEEVLLVFRESWYSWAETEPAITAVRKMILEDK